MLKTREISVWRVDVKGKAGDTSWEISVLRSSNVHGMRSYGWFGDDKLLVSHNGGPCRWPINEFVWSGQILIANALCDKLNGG
jgi:hypothetical protein